MKKERADKLLVMRGLAPTREKAQALIMAGSVELEGRKVLKPGELVDPEREMTVIQALPYVSRGGLKLEEALNTFGISVEGSVAVDIGSSTGGFSDCLLKRGARKIYAVDVNTRQLDSRLRHDSRVMPVEKNARYLSKDDFDEPPDIVALDVSFISVLKILPAVKDFIGNGWIICLLKPQFEVGRHEVGKKGIVKDPFLHEDALRRILASAEALGLRLGGVMRCSLRGQKGNREFFALWSMTKLALGPMEIEKKIKEAVWDEKSA